MTELTDVLAEYKRKGYSFEDASMVRSGKEATIYHVEDGGTPYALKVYKDPANRAFQKQGDYLEGKYYALASVRKAIRKGNAFAKKFTHRSWIKREYSLLKHLNGVGAAVPKVYDWTLTSILMQFIGNGAEPAPRLIDVQLDLEEARGAFDAVLETIKLFLAEGVVHSDLSAYNILWWKGHPCIIDFPQAIDIRQNPNKGNLLKRDLDNVMEYFGKYFPIDHSEVYRDFGIEPLANDAMDRGA